MNDQAPPRQRPAVGVGRARSDEDAQSVQDRAHRRGDGGRVVGDHQQGGAGRGLGGSLLRRAHGRRLAVPAAGPRVPDGPALARPQHHLMGVVARWE